MLKAPRLATVEKPVRLPAQKLDRIKSNLERIFSIVFFPILINTVVGVRAVPDDLYDLMRSLQAGRWQIFYKLEVPSALPVLLGGLRIGATLAVIGAVVGEFVGSDRGLGFLINVGRGQYDIALVFVAVFSLVFMALVLYGVVILVERRLLAWQQRAEGEIVH